MDHLTIADELLIEVRIGDRIVEKFAFLWSVRSKGRGWYLILETSSHDAKIIGFSIRASATRAEGQIQNLIRERKNYLVKSLDTKVFDELHRAKT